MDPKFRTDSRNHYLIEKTKEMPADREARRGLWAIDTQRRLPRVWIGCPFCGSLNDASADWVGRDGNIPACFVCRCGRRMHFFLLGWWLI